jgi:hypothetical protein
LYEKQGKNIAFIAYKKEREKFSTSRNEWIYPFPRKKVRLFMATSKECKALFYFSIYCFEKSSL